MDFSFSEEQTLLRNTIQSFIQDNYDFDKRREIIQSEEGMSKDNWKQLADLGLLGVPFSENDDVRVTLEKLFYQLQISA